MPDLRRANCRSCGTHRDECGEISWSGYCGPCGLQIASDANDDLHFHRGPVFEKWRRAMVACVGGVLIDDLERR